MGEANGDMDLLFPFATCPRPLLAIDACRLGSCPHLRSPFAFSLKEVFPSLDLRGMRAAHRGTIAPNDGPIG